MLEPVGHRPSVGSVSDSVTRQLIALEEILGTALVERAARHLSLTRVASNTAQCEDLCALQKTLRQ